MAAYLGTCYPQLFHGIAIHSSTSYLRANNAALGLINMKYGPKGITLKSQKCKGFQKNNLLVIHGRKDKVVHLSNAQILMSDFAKPGSYSSLLIIDQLKHEWSGGAKGHKYSQPAGISSSNVIRNFFAAIHDQ